jgi:hypothetical protein
LSARGRVWKIILKTTGIGGLFVWFAFIGAFEHFDATRPIKQDAQEGRVIPQNNHGHIVYLTGEEHRRLHVMQQISLWLFLIAIVAACFIGKKEGGRGRD